MMARNLTYAPSRDGERTPNRGPSKDGSGLALPECGICGYQDCICDAKADAEWDEQQEYGANRTPPRE